MLLVLVILQPCQLIKCVFYFSSFLLRFMMTKRVMLSKSIKPRFGTNLGRRMVIKRAPREKIRIYFNRRKT